MSLVRFMGPRQWSLQGKRRGCKSSIELVIESWTQECYSVKNLWLQGECLYDLNQHQHVTNSQISVAQHSSCLFLTHTVQGVSWFLEVEMECSVLDSHSRTHNDESSAIFIIWLPCIPSCPECKKDGEYGMEYIYAPGLEEIHIIFTHIPLVRSSLHFPT